MAAGIDDEPFFFDTGATSHISPVKGDFVELKPIAPRNIRGVNGIASPAIGTGLIKLRCSKGRNLTLRDTLYAPQAALHLISVGRLGDEGYTMTFDAQCCCVVHSSKIMAQGAHEDRSLYRLQGSTNTVEQANIA